MLTLLYISCRAVLRLLFRVFFRLTVHGSESVPSQGAVIVAANHRSYLDPPVLCAALRRKVTFLAMKELFAVPLLGPLLRPYCIPVDRERPLPSTVKEALACLQRGEALVIFPEGGIRAEGEAVGLKRGTILIAQLSGAPVIPARIEGTSEALPPDRWTPRPAKIRVSFSPALRPEDPGSLARLGSGLIPRVPGKATAPHLPDLLEKSSKVLYSKTLSDGITIKERNIRRHR